MSYESTTFFTSDHTPLSCRIYHSSSPSPSPGLVIHPGFNCPLTMLNLPSVASSLQSKGLTVLLYDPRGIGSSPGTFRGDIDPPQYISDLSDALTHLRNLASVNKDEVGIAGFSFGGTIALTTAAVDTRVKFVIALAPLTDLDFVSEEQRFRVLKKCMQDKESQVLGNEPVTVRVIDEEGKNPVGFGHEGGFDKEKYGRLVREGREGGEGWVNKVSLESYWKISLWTPWPLWKLLGRKERGLKGLMWVVPGRDEVSWPWLQERYFGEIEGEREGKGGEVKVRKWVVDGLGHEEILNEENYGVVMEMVWRFVRECLNEDE
ncbi:Alpha/Beta hydrolase protein [Podospora fimiseda]|uniref:Alpha/Beta hydrolase protein n=1 Tax=Podospora fimiseda TaxID=252190 RepID=A0AAN6YTS2_9PEZI|nr:Alpha/Beta hydrolase protein [Podospora fimiseda]